MKVDREIREEYKKITITLESQEEYTSIWLKLGMGPGITFRDYVNKYYACDMNEEEFRNMLRVQLELHNKLSVVGGEPQFYSKFPLTK